MPGMRLGAEEPTTSLHMNRTPVEALRMVLTQCSLPVTKETLLCLEKPEIQTSRTASGRDCNAAVGTVCDQSTGHSTKSKSVLKC